MSQDLRNNILKHLAGHSKTPQSGTYVDDTKLADVTGAPVEDVCQQLDILETQGYIKPANTMGSHAAIITPQGLLLVEQQEL